MNIQRVQLPSDGPSWLIFFCFPGELRDVVKRVAVAVQEWLRSYSSSYRPVFFDEFSIPIGCDIDTAINVGIRRSVIFMPFISHHVVSRIFEKEYPREEMEQRFSTPDRKKTIIPVEYDIQGRRPVEQGVGAERDQQMRRIFGDLLQYPFAVRRAASHNIDEDLIPAVKEAIANCLLQLPNTPQLPSLTSRLWPSKDMGGYRLARGQISLIFDDSVPQQLQSHCVHFFQTTLVGYQPRFVLVYLTDTNLNDERLLQGIYSKYASGYVIYPLFATATSDSDARGPYGRRFLSLKGITKKSDNMSEFARSIFDLIQNMYWPEKPIVGLPAAN